MAYDIQQLRRVAAALYGIVGCEKHGSQRCFTRKAGKPPISLCIYNEGNPMATQKSHQTNLDLPRSADYLQHADAATVVRHMLAGTPADYETARHLEDVLARERQTLQGVQDECVRRVDEKRTGLIAALYYSLSQWTDELDAGRLSLPDLYARVQRLRDTLGHLQAHPELDYAAALAAVTPG